MLRNFTEIVSNSLLRNNFTGVYINNSNNNNITTNTIDNHHNAVFLHSSNHTFVINNTGNENINDIIELNCDNTNYFEGNVFSKITSIREDDDDDNESNKNSVVVDFTIVLILCLGGFTICISLKKVFLDLKIKKASI